MGGYIKTHEGKMWAVFGSLRISGGPFFEDGNEPSVSIK
jgi:hypothetical protein